VLEVGSLPKKQTPTTEKPTSIQTFLVRTSFYLDQW
jgi:hypothetical protein